MLRRRGEETHEVGAVEERLYVVWGKFGEDLDKGLFIERREGAT